MPRIGGARISGHSNVCPGRGGEGPDSKTAIHRLTEIEVLTHKVVQRVELVESELDLFGLCQGSSETIFTQWAKGIIRKSKFEPVRYVHFYTDM